MRDLDAPAPTPEQRARYRVAWYKTPAIWRRHSAEDETWKALTSADLVPWWIAHPEATCSERSAKALAWMEREFGR